MRQVSAALVIIGDEILSGKTQDTNTQTIATALNSVGVQLREMRVIPDEKQTIIETVNTLRAAHNYLFTTGGLGPTHDDITAESLAEAYGVELELDIKARDVLATYYASRGEDMTAAREKMVMLPKGAIAIPNSVTAAPGFQFENVYTLAGVPKIMAAMLEFILPTLEGGHVVKSISVSTNIGESQFSDALTALQSQTPAVSIGSYPKFDGNSPIRGSIVIRSTDELLLKEVLEKVKTLLKRAGGDVLEECQIH